MAQLLKGFSIFSLASFGWGCSGILVLILILVICLHKWKKQTVIFLQVCGCIVLFGVMPVAAVFCGVNVNGYLGAEGGIFGKIKTSLGINTGIVRFDTFEVSELNLRLDENGEYSATVRVNIEDAETVIKLNPNKKYNLLVNGALTSDNFMSTTGETIALSADYTYAFNDFQRNEIAKDTLHIAFMLNKDDIVCRLSTEGGAVAKDLWKLYYRKNGMKIKFVESDYQKPPILNEGEGDTSQYCVLTFKDEDELILSKMVSAGTALSDIPSYSKYGFVFEGWTADGENLFDFTQEIRSDITLFAKLNNQASFKYYLPANERVITKHGFSYQTDNGILYKGFNICDIKNENYKGFALSDFKIHISKLIVKDADGNQFYFKGTNDLRETGVYYDKDIGKGNFYALKVTDYSFISTLNGSQMTDEYIRIGFEYYLAGRVIDIKNGVDIVSIEISSVEIFLQGAEL